MNNFARIKAIEAKNKKRILEVCPDVDERSGIYIFYRTDENNIKHAYIGKAKNLLKRLYEHLSGYQYIDLSIKKHGFFSLENKTGYEIVCYYYPIFQLDEKEQHWIKTYAYNRYQLKNRNLGGTKGSCNIAETKPAKGYYDGLKQGYKNAKRDVAKWVKYLTIDCDRGKKRAITALEKFSEFLGGE